MQKLLASTALSGPTLSGALRQGQDDPRNQSAEHPSPEGNKRPQGSEGDYWDGLIGEEVAAKFLSLRIRTLQGWRYKGGGPRYVRVSARCIRYRRADLRVWAEARLRTSTSDTGPQPDAA